MMFVFAAVLAPDGNLSHSSVITQGGPPGVFSPQIPPVPPPLLLPSSEPTTSFITPQTSPGKEDKIHPSALIWEKPGEILMPPPPSNLLQIQGRRSSVQMIVPDQVISENVKTEVPEPVLNSMKPVVNVPDLSSTQSPSMDTFHKFVSNSSLPSINVSSYLSNIEGNAAPMASHMLKDVPSIMIPPQNSVKQVIFPGNSSNLLTTVEPSLVNQSRALQFEGRPVSMSSSAAQSAQENLSVIVNTAMIQKKTMESQVMGDSSMQKQIPEQQNARLDLLVSALIEKQRTDRMTERLDAFVNSAADSHISPNPEPSSSSVITENSTMHPINDLVMSGASDTKSDISSMMQTSQGSISNIQSSLNIQNPSNNQHDAQVSINNLLNSVPSMSTNQNQVLSHLQQFDSQTANSSHLNASSINNLVQATSLVPSNQVQELANVEIALEQGLSPTRLNSKSHSELNQLIQSPTHIANHQAQNISELQASIEDKLSPNSLSSSVMNPPELNDMIQSSTQNSVNGVQTFSNMQISLEQHLSPQNGNPSPIAHSEPVQLSGLASNNGIHISNQTSTNEVQALSNIGALECHLNNQVVSNQANHESISNGNVTIISSLPTSPQIEVSQAQHLSNLQASLEQHLSSQGLNPAQAMLSMAQRSLSQSNLNTLNSPLEREISQNHTLTSLQMSLNDLNSQQSHEAITTSTVSLPTSPQIQNSVTQVQVISSLQESMQHHLSSQVMGVSQSPHETMMPIQNMVGSSHTSQQQSLTLSGLQTSLDHLSSQGSNQSRHSESITTNNLSMSNSQTIDLTGTISVITSQPLNIASETSSRNSPDVLSSPSSHHNSVHTPSGVSINCSPTMTLSPTNHLTMHNSQQMEINSSNISLGSSQDMSSTEMSMNRSSTLLMTPSELQMQHSQNIPQGQNDINRFEEGHSQRVPVQVSSVTHFDQCQDMQCVKKSTEVPTTVAQTNVQHSQQPPVQGTKKCEENMPLPHQLTQMSETDLISYIDPSTFDTV